MSALKQKFETKILPELKKELGAANFFEVPAVKKIVLNCGIGRFVAGDDKKDQKQAVIEEVTKILSSISGQKPRGNRAQKSIAGFKLREGDLIGLSVTIRGERMYSFLEKFVNVVLPRVRDFRGIPEKSVSPEGILNIGLKEHIVFPELVGEDFRRIYGLQVTMVPTESSREAAMKLYKVLKVPFQSSVI